MADAETLLEELNRVRAAMPPPAHTTIYWPSNVKFPECSFCSTKAIIDGRTQMGPWGFMCEEHYLESGVGLGTGRGQLLIEVEELP
jgi:hypothetical protein